MFILIPVTDWVNLIPAIAQLGITVFQSLAMLWIITGGWRYLLRSFAFNIDVLLAKYIGVFYGYFKQFIDLEMFNDTVLNSVTRNIYVFIGVIMFFRLAMVLLKYLVNPDLVDDAKLGVNNLIKRIILGIVGILMLPMIFDLALNLQKAILEDGVIQQIIIPHDYLETVNKIEQKGGQCIGTYVLMGFVNPRSNATSADRTAFQNAEAQCDMGLVDDYINDGAFLNIGGENAYRWNYAYIVSTMCMAYVLLQMIKYCLDMATRGFRMLIYKILAPVAMIEYMIKGADDGVFKSWKSAILGTYFMIFVRVLSLWFVLFVMSLMIGHSTGDTTYAVYVQNSLLETDDYLLRAIIIVALIGFMMDLPKLIGSVFGLDLEQQGNADGLVKSITGTVKGAVTGGLAMGGAAVGGLASAGLSMGQMAAKSRIQQRGFKDSQGNTILPGNGKTFGENFISNLKDKGTADKFAKSAQAQRKTGFGAVPFLKDAYGGAAGAYTAGYMGSSIQDARADLKKDQEKEDQKRRDEYARRTAEATEGTRDNTDRIDKKVGIQIENDIAFKAGGEMVHADGAHALDVSAADSELQANRNIRTAVNNQYSTVAGGELRDAGGIDGLQPVQSTTIDQQDSVLAHHRTVRNIESETVGGDVVDISTGAVTGNIDRSESIAGKIDTDVNLQRNMNAHVMGGDTVDVSTGAVTGTIDQKNSISGKIDTEVNLQRNLNAHIAGGETVDVDTGAVTGNIDKKESISGQIQTDVNLQRNLNAHVMGGDTVDVDTGEVTGSVDQENSIEGRLNTNVNIAHNINSTLSGGTKVDETTGEETGEEVSEDQSISKNIRKAVNVATNISSKLTGGETVDEDTGEANGNIEEEDSIAGKIDAKNDSED